ncbi:MAG: hypothetical protein AB1778_08585 [Candidatus Bipolaricaulota bacterium]
MGRAKPKSLHEEIAERFAKTLCPALNYLLDVSKGGKSTQRRRGDAVYLLSSLAAQSIWRGYHPVHRDAQMHKQAKPVVQALARVSEAATAAIAALDAWIPEIAKRVEREYAKQRTATARRRPASFAGDYAESLTYYTKVQSMLDEFSKRLSAIDPERAAPPYELPEDMLRDLTGHIRTLILVQDATRMRHERTAEDHEREATIHAAFGHDARLDPILPQRYEEEGAKAALALNKHLLTERVNFRIVGQPPGWRRESCDGREVEPFFAAFLSPFLAVIAGEVKPVRLGVCEVCGSVYVRQPRNSQGRVCDGNCRSAQRRLGRAARRDLSGNPRA